MLTNNPLNIEFRRALTGDRWISLLKLVEKLMNVNLSDNDDVFLWRLTNTKKVTVSSMYSDSMHGHTLFLRKYLCKLKDPLKIKIFMWFLQRKVLLPSLDDIGTVVKSVLFVMRMSPLNTCLSLALLLEIFGDWFISLLTSLLLLVYLICLGIG